MPGPVRSSSDKQLERCSARNGGRYPTGQADRRPDAVMMGSLLASSYRHGRWKMRIPVGIGWCARFQNTGYCQRFGASRGRTVPKTT